MRQIGGGEKVRVDLDESAQHRLGKNFRSHRAMEKEAEIFRRPGRYLSANRVQRYGCAGVGRPNEKKEEQDDEEA